MSSFRIPKQMYVKSLHKQVTNYPISMQTDMIWHILVELSIKLHKNLFIVSEVLSCVQMATEYSVV